METLADYFWLCLSALGAGIVNALAGGGTLLTFPALIGILERQSQFSTATASVLANGTSTTALVPASLGSAWGFRRELADLKHLLVWLLPPSLIGGTIGTLLVTRLPPDVFAALIPWLILLAAVLFLVQPLVVRRKASLVLEDGRVVTDGGLANVTSRSLLGMMGLQLLIGIYGGYFGAGIGILMLSGLGFMGLTNIHQMNGLKAVLGTAINGVSVAIWIVEQKVVWEYALAMMAMSLVGGYCAARFSRQVPGIYVRWLIITIGFGLAFYYFAR
jgi:uncharacterized membrane protein YfcA